jgi:hypothetical protein
MENKRIGQVGFGKIGENGESYEGTLPFEPNEEVVILRQRDLELMVQGEMGMLLHNSLPMMQSMYTPRQERGNASLFPDGFQFNLDGEQRRFYLDRNLYSNDFTKHFFIRYETLQEAIDEHQFYDENLKEDGPDVPKEQDEE